MIANSNLKLTFKEVPRQQKVKSRGLEVGQVEALIGLTQTITTTLIIMKGPRNAKLVNLQDRKITKLWSLRLCS